MFRRFLNWLIGPPSVIQIRVSVDDITIKHESKPNQIQESDTKQGGHQSNNLQARPVSNSDEAALDRFKERFEGADTTKKIVTPEVKFGIEDR